MDEQHNVSMTVMPKKCNVGGNVRMVISPSHRDTNPLNLLPTEITRENHSIMRTMAGCASERNNRCIADTLNEVLLLVTAAGKRRHKIISIGLNARTHFRAINLMK